MKSEHRHELKTNELAEWIANFPQWARENMKMIIYVSVFTIAVGGSFFWHKYTKNVIAVQKQVELLTLVNTMLQSKVQLLGAQARGVDVSYMLMQPADNLKNFAQKTKDNQMAALALIKRAEAIRTELHYRLDTVTSQDRQTQLSLAKTDYTEAFEKSSDNPSLRAAARFGLGICEEDLGNFEKAKQIYRDITENADFQGTTAVAQAKMRLRTMADYQQKIVFKPAPKQAQIEPIRPEINLKSIDINLPSQ